MQKECYNITGMSCSACSARVEKAVAKLIGADNVSVNLLTNSMQVKHDSDITSTEIINAVIDAGYGASLKMQNAECRMQNDTSTTSIVEDEINNMEMRLKWSRTAARTNLR